MAYTAEATTIAGRNGRVESKDGAISLDLAVPRRDGTPYEAEKTNPEALFAAGYSACFSQAILAAAEQEKLKPEQVAVTALVTLHADEQDYDLSVVLRARIDGLARGQAEHLVQAAHELCPYSKAVRGNIPVDLELV